MEHRPMPPVRTPRTNTPLVFSEEAAWREQCDALDAINNELEPLVTESQALQPQSSELRTPELRGKPAFSDYMGARRGGYRMLLDFPSMGAEYTVEHMASIRNNLASTPDYIERIKQGLTEDAGFAEQRAKIEIGLEKLRTVTAIMQGIAQKTLHDFSASPAGNTATGKAIAERYVAPPIIQIT